MLTAVVVCSECNTLLGCVTLSIQNGWFIMVDCIDCPLQKSELQCWSEEGEDSCIFSICDFCQAEE